LAAICRGFAEVLKSAENPLKTEREENFVARTIHGSIRANGRQRVAFIFSGKMSYPPSIHDMKVYYLSQEMKRRGVSVNWVRVGGREKRWDSDGIRFAVLSAPSGPGLLEAFRLMRLFLFCAIERIQLVYLDEWLFLRKNPMARLLSQMILRRMGVKLVLDERDPFVDFEVAAGELLERTRKYRFLSMMQSLLLRQTDLIILPSKAYSTLYESEGIPRTKVLGSFRGIDPELFKPQNMPNVVRSNLNLDGSFVIGWFGLMHSYRMIREIIIPLLENSAKEMPNVHFLIGGEGPLLNEFERVRNGQARSSFTLLGTVPYAKLPEHIAACDVTMCPVSTNFRMTTHSNWLKIAESLAVGIPVVATRTEASTTDYGGMKGVVWVDSDYGSFLSALKNIQKDSKFLRSEARYQARQFESYVIGYTIPKIVDRVLALIKAN
jgi:glycosyltransferase involved in cell wall biosynthesis